MAPSAVIGESDARLKVAFPDSYPQSLIVRGTGACMFERLDQLGEDCSSFTGVVLLHIDGESEQLLGPRFYLRGEPVTIAMTPKMIWGTGTKGEK